MSKGIVSTLYNIDGDTSKRKIIEMKKVMMGALSKSKSATGEEVFKSNQFQNIELRKRLHLLDRASLQCKKGHNSRKRTALRQWSLVFEKQKSMNESIRELDGVLSQALEDKLFMVSGKTKEERAIEESELAELRRLEEMNKPEEVEVVEEPTQTSMDPAQIRALMIKAQGGASKKHSVAGGTLLLPKIDFGDTTLKVEVESVETETKEKEDIWPLKDTKWISQYVQDERVHHGELFTRNILKNIKYSLTKDHSFYKFRLRSNLSSDPIEFLKTTSAKSRPSTRIRNKPPTNWNLRSAPSPRLGESRGKTASKTVTILEPSSSRNAFPIYSTRKEKQFQPDREPLSARDSIGSSRSQRPKKNSLPSLVRSKTMG